MIEVKSYLELPEVVDHDALASWRNEIDQETKFKLPADVDEFITAIAGKMRDFEEIKKYNSDITGEELILSNIKEWNGERVYPWGSYILLVPHMVAVDHHKWMCRSYRRKGKQGLIDYCKAQVKNTDLERILEILEVEVFHHERKEFSDMMDKINASKKIDSVVDV